MWSQPIRETRLVRESPRRFRLPGFPTLFLLLALPRSLAFAQTADTTLRVSGPCVVFFGPSRAERDSIVRNEGLEIDDVMDDFNYYAGKTAVFLTRSGIPAQFTDSRMVIVKIGMATFRMFDRRSIQDPVGMILSDGVHEPRVIPGRGTDRDLILQIREFFRLDRENEH